MSIIKDGEKVNLYQKDCNKLLLFTAADLHLEGNTSKLLWRERMVTDNNESFKVHVIFEFFIKIIIFSLNSCVDNFSLVTGSTRTHFGTKWNRVCIMLVCVFLPQPLSVAGSGPCPPPPHPQPCREKRRNNQKKKRKEKKKRLEIKQLICSKWDKLVSHLPALFSLSERKFS